MTQEELLRLNQEVYQQDAYQKGQAIKRIHMQQQRVLQGGSLLILAADFAHLFLSKELHCGEISNPHTRAALRMRAFWQGYQDGALKAIEDTEEAPSVTKRSVQDHRKHHKKTRSHPRSKRRGKKHAHQST